MRRDTESHARAVVKFLRRRAGKTYVGDDTQDVRPFEKDRKASRRSQRRAQRSQRSERTHERIALVNIRRSHA